VRRPIAICSDEVHLQISTTSYMRDAACVHAVNHSLRISEFVWLQPSDHDYKFDRTISISDYKVDRTILSVIKKWRLIMK
jgi:hypothetical protein